MTINSIYVSNSGNDLTGDGTILHPYATLQKVTSVLINSTTIYLEKGSVFNNGKLDISNKNNIVICSYGSGDAPIIAGCKTVTGWINEGGNIWSHQDDDFPDEITNVFIGGYKRTCARYPISTFEQATGGASTPPTATLIDTGLTDPDNYWDNAELVIRYYDWATGIDRVTSYTSKTFTYSDYNNRYYAKLGTEYYIQNHRNCLSVANTWAYDNITKILYIYSLAEPVNVEASYGDNSIYINNSKYIEIKDIDINKACEVAILIYYSSRIKIDNVRMTYSGIYSIAFQYCKNIVITNCYGYSQNNDFIVGEWSENVFVKNNEALLIGVDQGAGRYISGFWSRGGTGGLTIQFCNNVVFKNNQIGYTSYSSLMANYGMGIIIMDNYVHHFNLNKYDGGGIYCNTAAFWHIPEIDLYYPYSGRLIKNIVVNGNALQNSYGPYIDNYSVDFEMGYNFTAGSKWNIILHESIRNHCHDNISVSENGTEAGLSYGMTFTPTKYGRILDNVFINKMTDAPSFYSVALGSKPNTVSGNKYFYPLGKKETDGDESINKMGSTWYTLAEWKADDSRVDWDRDTEEELTPSISPGILPKNDFLYYIINPAKTVKTVQSTDVPFDDYMDLDGVFQTYPFDIDPYESKILVRAPKPEILRGEINGANIKQLLFYSSVKLDETKIPATTEFALAGKTITNVAISNNVLTLTTTEDNLEAETLVVTYSKPGSNPITAYYGGLEMDSGSFSANLIKFVLTSTGTGLGVSTCRIIADEAITVTIDGTGKFYTDSGGTLGETDTWTLTPGLLTTIYIRVPSGSSNMKFTNGLALTQIYTWSGTTNCPSISGDLGRFVKLTWILISANNTLSGSIENLRDLITIGVQSNNTLSGSTANLISLYSISIRGANTINYDFTRLKRLCNVEIAYNLLTSEQVNALLAQIWANRDEPKGSITRSLNLSGKIGSGAPTGQGLIDKANLQNYSSPCNNPAYLLWTVTTR